VTAANPLDAVLGSASLVIVPGIARWLGLPESPPADGPEETWEAYCARISTIDHFASERNRVNVNDAAEPCGKDGADCG
jgi:hypothetical protein